MDSLSLGLVFASSAMLILSDMTANLALNASAISSHDLILSLSREQYHSNAGPDRLCGNWRRRRASSLMVSPQEVTKCDRCSSGLPPCVPSPETVSYLGTGYPCLLYTSPSPRDGLLSRMPSSA